MRIRSIRPEFWSSDDVGNMPWEVRLFYIGLWSYVDDNGVGRDEDALIASALFPFDMARDASRTLAQVTRGLAHLSEHGQITRYTHDGRRLIHIRAWDEHQRIDRPTKPRYPLPTSEDAAFDEPSRNLHEPSTSPPAMPATGEGEKGRRGEGEKKTSSSSASRTRSAANGTRLPDDWLPRPELIDQMAGEAPHVDQARELRKFTDYWRATPGAKGRKTDWDATYRNWIRTAAERAPRTGDRRQQATDDLFARAMARAAAADAADAARASQQPAQLQIGA